MAPHVQVQAGGVATAHLEPVECRECLLDGEVPGDRCDPCLTTRQLIDQACGADAVVSHGPDGIADGDQLGVGLLDRVRAELG